MKCRKQFVLTDYRVQFVDIRNRMEPNTVSENVEVSAK